MEEREPKGFDWDKCIERKIDNTHGDFARLLVGQTDMAARDSIQVGFNRKDAFPCVLVAQSSVGSEGLNLHKACDIIVFLHPEWNPRLLEQGIGRVDRIGSLWEEKCKDKKIRNPKIDVRPVVFSGTYDESNWKELHQRWNELRAFLNAEIVPPGSSWEKELNKNILKELNKNIFNPKYVLNRNEK